jgi:hypothetical protein
MSMDPGKPDRMRRIHAERRAARMEQIEDMVEAGRSWEEICAHYGVSSESLSRWLSRNGRAELTAAAKTDPFVAQRMRWKLQAKARLGLPQNCNDHDFYREVALALKREELIPRRDVDWSKVRLSKKEAYAKKRRRARQARLLPVLVAERFPELEELIREVA